MIEEYETEFTKVSKLFLRQSQARFRNIEVIDIALTVTCGYIAAELATQINTNWDANMRR